MSETKERKMSPKGFLHKSTTKAANSAIAFLSQYREWLLSGELAPVASPILRKMDQGELLPTPALKEIQNAVLAHIVAKDTARLQETLEEVNSGEGRGTSKNWQATVYNSKGEVQTRTKDNGEVEDLIKGFDDSSSADRWADRRLFDGAPDWYAEVVHTKMNVRTVINRADAIARILKQPKGPTMYQKGKSTKTLGFGVKVKEDRFSFSRG